MTWSRDRGVRRSLAIDAMRCPRCQAAFSPSEEGVCCSQGHVFALREGYLDFSGESLDASTSRTFDSFSYEWTTFDRFLPEDEGFWLRYFTDVSLHSSRPSLALDAGCGQGRFSRFTARHVGFLVALDGSTAAAVAARSLAEFPNVLVVRSDLRTAPFAGGTFGFIS